VLSDVVDGIFEFILHIFIEVVCFYIVEIVFYILTFRRKKPRRDYYPDESPTKFVILTENSLIVVGQDH